MNKNLYGVIMAGGLGTRFWPMSRTAHPKQFIDILGTGKTLLQQSFERIANCCPVENIFIVTNEMYRDITLKQLPQMRADRVLCEPARRNTAPCIAYAVYKILEENPEASMVVAPSDHIVLKEEIFTDIVDLALHTAASKDWLVTLGIKPNRPDTGYGYIQFVPDTKNVPDERIKKVKTFTEKPNHELAKSFIQSGDFLWNSGIFIWSAKSISKAFEEHLPEVDAIFREGIGKYNTSEEEAFIRKAYSVCKSISIDYGVMEKADNVYVIGADFGWSDLGTWGSLYENMKHDDSGNAISGKNVMTYQTKNCIVNVPNNKLVVLEGLHDYIVVESDNILLVCKKTDEQEIRQFVNDVKIDKGEHFV
ncbi:MAG: mannose-1-phosphate guanylyltransferase [Bacteroidota bacterium]